MYLVIPVEEPSILFPVGAIIEDEKARYKILEEPRIESKSHIYKCEVLERSVPLNNHILMFHQLQQERLVVLAQNMKTIKRIE